MTTKIPANLLESTLDLSSHTITLPPNGSRAGDVVQVVNTQTGAVATGTTVLPSDDTIPQSTEGDQYMTLAITPKSATNKLKIEVVCNCTHSASNNTTAALFKDSDPNALAAGTAFTGANWPNSISFTHYMDAGSTSAITFKVRAGGGGAGTTTFNGNGSARKLGGVMASSITITEIKV